MPKLIAVIDADTLLYAEALKAEVKMGEGYLPLLPIERVEGEVVKRLDEYVAATKADDAILAITSKRNFRKELLSTYKANRMAAHKPIMLESLRQMISEEEPFPVYHIDGLEADDVCGIAAGQLQEKGRDTVIISSDKDLRQIPGKLWNPRKRKDGSFNPIETITRAQGDEAHLYQTLIGDPVDNYTGLPGMGPIKAARLLATTQDLTPAERWGKIIEAFAEKGFPPEYAITQARVARILRQGEWDAVAKKPILWEPPVD